MNKLTTGAAHARRRAAQSPELLALLLAGCASVWSLASAAAVPAPDDHRSVILRSVNLHPRDREGPRALLQRVDDAAMEACGASEHSLREVRATVHASQCWKRAMADAVRRIDDPFVSEACWVKR